MSKTIEEIKDQVAKETGFHCWLEHKDTGIYDSDVNLIAQRYAKSQAQELQKQNAEIVEMLGYIFYKTNFQNHFPTTSIKVKNLLNKRKHLNKK